MALGGVLRAALKAGDWARAAAQSRRQARALRQFSPEFGQRSMPVPADEFIMRSREARGLPADLTPEDTWNSLEVFRGGARPRAGAFLGESPFGGNVYGTGMGRQRFAGEGLDFNMRGGYGGDYGSAFDNGYRAPIMAPYEGGRAWPSRTEMGVPVAYRGQRILPWVGRGRPNLVRYGEAASSPSGPFEFMAYPQYSGVDPYFDPSDAFMATRADPFWEDTF
jgi:hypothetical protein